MNSPTLSTLIALALCVIASPYASAQSDPATAPDNSKSNEIEQSDRSPTADSQSNTASDIDLTKRIRENLMADKSLSTYAHNVKIVTVNGSVTLNGVVRSHQEKNTVETKAAEVAGKANVTDDLKVASGS